MAAFAGDSGRPMSQFPPLSRDQRRCRLEILHLLAGAGGPAWRSDCDSASRFPGYLSPKSAGLLASSRRCGEPSAKCTVLF